MSWIPQVGDTVRRLPLEALPGVVPAGTEGMIVNIDKTICIQWQNLVHGDLCSYRLNELERLIELIKPATQPNEWLDKFELI